MKIAMFGGTFNPIHKSHIYVLTEAVELLGLDKILVIPTYIPPHKEAPDLIEGSQRLEMIRLSIAGNPKLEACDYEIIKKGPSYTYETLEWISKTYKPTQLYLIMGSDMFLTLNDWKNPETIYDLAIICVVSRDKADDKQIFKYEAELENKGVKVEVLSSKSRPLSSTAIRELVKRNKAINELVTPEVAEYIEEHELYK